SWKHLNTYIERGINKLYSRLIIGDSYTQSEVFDSINFRGFQLSSDEVMLPDSQRGFAPIIRGVARSNAEVTIQQNGYVIYRNSFPPGP
ncbi:fimbria/pilus outer membrane usher protein, partial [Enterobacter cloacae]